MAKRALCIGINDYPGVGSDLAGCVNDVLDWTKALEDRGYSVQKLIDRDATKSAMIEAIAKLIRDAAPGDRVVLQYSGHGSWVPDEDGDESDERDEVLCPCDIGAGSFLSDDELHDLFSERKHGVRLLFLSDSCHSGTVSRLAPVTDEVPDRAPRARFLPPGVFLSETRTRAARAMSSRSLPVRRPQQGLLISGCMDTQTSADAWFANRPNGAFSYYALRALRALKPGATYREWHAAIRRFLPSTAYTQQPNLYGTKAQKAWKVLE